MSRQRLAEIYDLAWPVLVAQLATMGYGVIDTMMTGRAGTDDLAAAGIGAAIYASVFVGLMGVLIAVSPTVAHLKGAERHGEIGEQVRQAMWLALVLAVMSILVFRFPEPFIALSDPPPAVAEKVRAFLAIAAWGVPAGLAFRLFSSYTTAVSRPRIMMVLNLAGLALKVPLNYVFIFGHAGAPAMGAAGCALATAIVSWIVCLLAWLRAATAEEYRPHGVFTRWSWPRWHDQWRLLSLGVPIGGSFLVDVTSFTFMALFIARLGAVNSAAHQIAANVAAVMYMLPLAMGNAVTVLVGQALGAGRYPLARSTGITGISLACAFGCTGAFLLAIGAHAVAALYTPDPAVQSLAATLLLFAAGYHVFDAMQAVTVNALRGYKRAVVPLVVNVVGMWCLGLAGGYVLGLTPWVDLSFAGLATPLGVRGLWAGAIAGMALSTLATLAYFLAVSARGRTRT
ncbi:MAG: MATE family efflux transporter [Burkholderiales bacterium]